MFLKFRFFARLFWIALVMVVAVICTPRVVTAQEAVCQTGESQSPAALAGGP
jgi:hypothetical protein